ncbi:MAG TPA: photosystem I assembly protein Ycf4 [Candidatus Caenarcaniphilales bacterium]
MSVQSISTSKHLLRYEVVGARRLSNYWWATIITLGASGFFLAGLSSYLKINLLPFSNPTDLLFVPQGLAMGLYGGAGLFLAAYLWLVIWLDTGAGYNEFDQQTGLVKIFRWGFLGKNRRLEISCRIADVQSVRIEIREGINPRRALYLRIKGRRDVPLTRVGQPLPLAELEDQGAEIARFLGVPVEGL